MRFIKLIILILLLYIYLHSPMIPSFGILGRAQTQYGIFILYIIALFFFFIKPSKFKETYNLFKNECDLFLIVFLYVVIRTVLGGESVPLIFHIKAIIELFFVPVFLISYINTCGIKKEEDLIRLLLIIGCIGGIITGLCLTVPSFNSYVRSNLMLLSENDYLFDKENRGFGISSGLTYEYGVIQGVIVALGLAYFKENKWFLLFVPLIIISIFVNARTGIVVASIGLILLFLNKKSFKSILIIGVAIYLLLINFEAILNAIGIDDSVVSFIMGFYDEVDFMIEGGNMEETTAGTLFGRMFILPDSIIEWIAGKGYYIFGRKTGPNSDMGFILQLNYGGLLYIIPFYYLIYKIAKRYRHNGYLKITILFVLTFFIANIKGPFLPDSGMFRLFVLLYIFCITKNNERNKSEKCEQYL